MVDTVKAAVPTSKKVRVWAFSILLIVAQFVALQLDVKISPETWALFAGVLGINATYLIAQGKADTGKEAVKEQAKLMAYGTSPGKGYVPPADHAKGTGPKPV